MNKNIWGWAIGAAIVLLVVIVAFRWWQGYIAGPSGGSEIATSTATSTPPAAAGNAQALLFAPKSGNSVVAIERALPNASRFQALFSQSGVAGSLTSKGPYTIFVPIDSAFNNLPPGTLAHLTAAEEKRLVEYHIVKGRALDIDAVSSGTIQALSGDMLNFHADVGTEAAQVNSAWAIRQYKGKNGVVYTISLVLLPPAKTP